jgi:hypothetical protein
VEEQVQQSDSVVGSLQREWREWEREGASEFVVRSVRWGLDFLPQNWRALIGTFGRPIQLKPTQVEWLLVEFRRLVGTEGVVYLGVSDAMPKELDYASPVFLVPKSGPKKYRLVVDMRQPNLGLFPPTFKMDRLEEFVRYAGKDWWGFTLDLREGYFHQLLSERAKRWVGAVFRDGEGKLHWYQYQVIPFGLNLSPVHFTELVKVLLKKWRRAGILCMGYIDDLAFAARSRGEALRLRSRVMRDLTRLGWKRHPEKGQWEPAQSFEYLGLIVDFKEGRWRVPERKAAALRQSLQSAVGGARISIRQLACILGKILSLQRALPLAKLYSRETFNAIFDEGVYFHNNWAKMVVLPLAAREDLGRVLAMVEGSLGAPLWRSPVLQIIQVTSDASGMAWGGHLSAEMGLQPAGGAIKEHMMDMGIEIKEAVALLYTLRSYVAVLRGRAIVIRTDNMWLAAYLRNEGGCGSVHQRNLSRMVREIFLWCLQNEVLIVDVQWLPTDLNVLADEMSRVVDHGNWAVLPWVFSRAEQLWGPHTVDRMASSENAKCRRFNSWRFCPGTEAINTFTEDWSGENSWVAPPLSMIGLVLDHIAKCRAMATLFIPNWRKVWSSLLKEMQVGALAFEEPPGDLAVPEANGGREVLKNPLWRFMLVRVDGSRVTRAASS